MNKQQEKECYLFGSQLALHCVRSADNNESFNNLFKGLDRNDRNLILTEIILFRSSFVASKIFSQINSKEKSNMIADYFFTRLSSELKIDSVAFLSNKALEYAQVSHQLGKNSQDTALVYFLVLKNAGIDVKKIDEKHFISFCDFLTNDLQKFWFGVKNMFDGFSKNTNKSFGCLGSILTFVFTISILIFIF